MVPQELQRLGDAEEERGVPEGHLEFWVDICEQVIPALEAEAAKILAYFRSRDIEIEMEAFEPGEHRIIFYSVAWEAALEAEEEPGADG